MTQEQAQRYEELVTQLGRLLAMTQGSDSAIDAEAIWIDDVREAINDNLETPAW